MDLKRFGRIVYERRTELGLTQEDVARNGGPTDTTLGKIENGEWNPGNRKITLRKLDTGLRWAEGSAQRTLAGGDPTPAKSIEHELDRARLELAELQKRRQVLGPERSSDADAQMEAALLRRIDVLLVQKNVAAAGRQQVQRDSHRRQLIDLWVRAQPLTQPGRLDADELTDSAVELARQVSAYTESQVGGYTKMQILAQAARGADDRAVGQQTIFEETENDVETEAAAGASAEGGPAQEVTRLPHWGRDTPPPPADLADAASRGEKASDFYDPD